MEPAVGPPVLVMRISNPPKASTVWATILFPWGVAFNSLGLASLIKMVIFIAFLLVGLAYAWKKGALTWE